MIEDSMLEKAVEYGLRKIEPPPDLLNRIIREADHPERWKGRERWRLGQKLEVAAAFILLVALIAVAAYRNLAVKPAPAGPDTGVHNAGPTIDADATFASSLSYRMIENGIAVSQVKRSKYESFFPTLHQAAWIQTDQGIVEAVFFSNASQAASVSVVETPDGDRFEYLVSLGDWQRTISANRRLYFDTRDNLWLFSESEHLVTTIKEM